MSRRLPICVLLTMINVSFALTSCANNTIPQLPPSTTTPSTQALRLGEAKGNENAWGTRRPTEVVEFPLRDPSLGFGGVTQAVNEDLSTAKVVQKPSNYRLIRIFFATNRAVQVSSVNISPTSQRGSVVTYGYSDVSIPAVHKLGNIERPAVWRLEFSSDEQKHIIIRTAKRVTSDIWDRDLREHALGSGQTAILFVHGFATTFEDAVMRAAQLKYDLAFPGPMILFSWPSKGSTLSYCCRSNNFGSSSR